MGRFILICMLTFSVFYIPSDVDASWLSKAWGRLEDSLDRADTHAPPSITDTRKDIGRPLSQEELKIAGVPMHARFEDVKASLGAPQYETKESLQYGGITFYGQLWQGLGRVSRIDVSNRDAVTARGIAVGDSLKQLVKAYGKPDFIKDDYYFYGYQQAYSDVIRGLYFTHDGKKIIHIRIVRYD